MAGGTQRVPTRALPPEEAITTFAEDNLGYSVEEAVAEAARARGRDISGASSVCPFGVDVGEAVRAVAGGDLDRALGVFLAAHPWPGIMGRHCRRMCERAHDLGDDEPLAIGLLERAAAEHGDRRRHPFVPGVATGRRVAVVGAGSAASAVAYRLRQRGHHVVVFEQLPVAGGMMFAGYPEFRLPLAVLREENDLEGWGCETRYDTRVDRDLLERLVLDYDAVVLGTGKFEEVMMGIPGEDLDGVWDALGFLTRVKLGRPPAVGPRVAVFGAGWTAQDVSRSCRRLGCEVTVYYRRTRDEMPLPHVAEAHIARQQAEGAPYVFLTTATRILGHDGRVTGVELVRTEPGPPDGSGRPGVVPVAGSEHVVACDTVIEATGETLDLSFLPPEVELHDGHVRVDPDTWMTSVPRLFAVGEVTGTPTTVMALSSGLRAADAVDRFLAATTPAPATAAG